MHYYWACCTCIQPAVGYLGSIVPCCVVSLCVVFRGAYFLFSTPKQARTGTKTEKKEKREKRTARKKKEKKTQTKENNEATTVRAKRGRKIRRGI